MRHAVVTLVLLCLAGPALAEQTKSYWGHQYSKDCGADREAMMEEAKAKAFSFCRSHGGVNKKKTDFIYVIDKGQKLGASFKTHFCEVKGDIYCNE